MGLMTDQSGEIETYRNGTAAKPSYGVTSCDLNDDGVPELLTSSYGRNWNNLWVRQGEKYAEFGRQTTYAGDNLLDYTDNEFFMCYCVDNPTDADCVAKKPQTPKIACYVKGVKQYAWNYDEGLPWRLNGNTFTTVCADINNDLRADLLTTEIKHWHIGNSSDTSQILKNVAAESSIGFAFERQDNKANGMFRDWNAMGYKNAWNEGDISGAVFDFDSDGLPDILLATSDYPGDRTFVFHQKEDGNFEEVAQTIGLAHKEGQEVTVADFDRDGDLDVVIGTSLMRWNSKPKPADAWVYYYENQMGDRKNSIEIRLVGGGTRKANMSAIGARVIVTTPDGKRQMREVVGGFGHFGLQNDLVVHFGLNDACSVSEIEVRWPDKELTVQKFSNIEANWLLEIEQGAEAPRYVIPFTKKQ
jgi:hypothetical protein